MHCPGEKWMGVNVNNSCVWVVYMNHESSNPGGHTYSRVTGAEPKVCSELLPWNVAFDVRIRFIIMSRGRGDWTIRLW